MEKRICVGVCGKEVDKYHNWCNDSDCRIQSYLKDGGSIHAPNGLPVTCFRYDGMMLECEHGDHPNYRIPVTVKYVGDDPDEVSQPYQLHAVIFKDEAMCLTLYECRYFMWSLSNGAHIGRDKNNMCYGFVIEVDDLEKVRNLK